MGVPGLGFTILAFMLAMGVSRFLAVFTAIIATPVVFVISYGLAWAVTNRKELARRVMYSVPRASRVLAWIVQPPEPIRRIRIPRGSRTEGPAWEASNGNSGDQYDDIGGGSGRGENLRTETDASPRDPGSNAAERA